MLATTLVGRVLSIFLSICSILIIAVVPGVITSYYVESTKLRADESSAKFLDDLERLPELSKEVCEKSIYTYIHDELGLKFGNAFRKFSALGADDEDVKELNVEKGSPILEVEQVVWLTNGKSIEYSTSHVPGNKRSYTVMNINNFN